MKIAVDAMGGDHAPEVVVEGAIEAVRDHGCEVLLVGDEARIRDEISRMDGRVPGASADMPGLTFRHTTEVIEMAEPPATAYKKKQDSSLVIAARAVGEGNADAFVSAGNTGACMTSAFLEMGRLAGVQRPAIALATPHAHGRTTVIDVGANVDCKASHLAQFAVMGAVYHELVLGIKNPKVGLLNVGEEEGKGNESSQKAFEMLKSLSLNFIGNIEGRDMLSGKADVIVCDGFMGNVILKFGESMSSVFSDCFRESVARRGLLAKLGAYLSKPMFREVRWTYHPSRVGGAPLLGVNGTCIIGHGSSNAQAISNAIQGAEKMITTHVNRQIQERLQSMGLGNGKGE